MLNEAHKSQAPQGARPWGWAILFGAILGLVFFASYNGANNYTATRSNVLAYVFEWEAMIPFWAWTIVPYWSIDFFYAAALFLCRTRIELFTLVKRLFLAQAICIASFLLWPLVFSFAKPEVGGLYGQMFAALGEFDKPFNQAPSLHIVLLVVLWRHYANLIQGPWLRGLMHVWCCLIALSVLTTYQHHFIDLLTGIWVGALCLFMLPDNRARWRLMAWRHSSARSLLALAYAAVGALVLAFGLMMLPAGCAWMILWFAAALLIVAALYAFGEPAHYGKQGADLPLSTWILLAPYILGARLNSMLWTARSPNGVHIQGNLYLGRQPRDGDIAANQIDAVFDLAAELPAPTRFDAWHSFPMQDLLPPDRDALCAGADALDRLLRHQRVWVCCALGFSRSSAMVCAWLIRHGDMRADAAISLVEVKRPQLVLSEAVIDTLYSLERAPT